MDTEVVGGLGGSGVPDSAPSIEVSSAPASTPSIDVSGAGTAATPAPQPGQASGAGGAIPATPGTPSTPAAGTPASWLSQLREAGVPYQGDDEKGAINALANLYKQFSQLQPLVPYVSAYTQHASQFAKYMEQQGRGGQPAIPAAQVQAKPWHTEFWNPPEFNPSWQQQIVRDPQTGVLSAAPGAPPDVVMKYQAYQNYRAEQAEKFMSNPAQYMEPIVRKLAHEEAQRLMQSQLGDRDATSTGQNLIRENASWIFQTDGAGNYVMNTQWDQQAGRMVSVPVYNEWGQRMDYYAKEAASMGINGVTKRFEYAKMRTQNDYMSSQMNQQRAAPAPAAPAAPEAPVGSPREQANKSFLTRANGKVPPVGNSVPAPAAPQSGKPDIMKRFKALLASKGQ